MNNRPLALCIPLGALALGAAAPPKPKPAPAVDTAFQREVAPLVKKYCLACHSSASAAGGVNLESARTTADVLKNRKLWESALANVAGRTMPPATSPQPTLSERDALAAALQGIMTRADCALNDPGRVTLRRLNRAEYNNTVRDLLGVTVRPADDFPSDDVGYGFDNIGDVLSISPLLMEKYLDAARKVARAAIVAPEDRLLKKPGKSLTGTTGGIGDEDAYNLSSNGDAGFDVDVVGSGRYELIAEVRGQQAGPEPIRLELRVDGKAVGATKVLAEPQSQTVTVQEPFQAAPGATKARVSVAFLNDYYDAAKQADRNLIIVSLAVRPLSGGAMAGGLPESHRRLLTTRPTEETPESWDRAARALLRPLARRAFRRIPAAEDVARLVKISRIARERGQSFERGMQLALQALLVSPNFLFKVELDANPDDAKKVRPLNGFELATRLSYFLWSSMPDDELLSVAESGRLQNPEVLLAQAKRMMADPKSSALAENFASQWLQLRKLDTAQPDISLFAGTGLDKGFDAEMRASMRGETEKFFTYVVTQDRSVVEFLDADYSFVNEPLARLYGIPGVTGKELRKTPLPPGPRGGLIGQAAILTLTSNPTRTSPVKRGRWVLENILGTPPPPPPPNVPPLPEAKAGGSTAATVRERLIEHRKNPACNACHQRLDGIGFAMENFDAVGRWRETDGGVRLDVSGDLPDGSRFDGAAGLKKLLLARKGVFVRNLTEQLLVYALGRGIENYDHCNIDAMAKGVAGKGYKFSALVAAVVTSRPFRERRGDDSGKLSSGKVAHR